MLNLQYRRESANMANPRRIYWLIQDLSMLSRVYIGESKRENARDNALRQQHCELCT